MTSVSKNSHIDILGEIVNKYNNKYHRKIKMKSSDVKSSIYISFNKENNKEGPKFKVADHDIANFVKKKQTFWWLTKKI